MKEIFKTIFIFLAILVVLGAISIFSLLSWYSYKTGDDYINKITKQAVEANDSSKCDKLIEWFMGDNYKQKCYSQVVIQNKNLNACADKGWLCFRVYFEYYKTNDQTLCKVIQNQADRDECYFQQNQIVHDIKLCSVIQSHTIQSDCYINLVGINKDTTICDIYISGQREKDICYKRAAGAFNKIKAGVKK